MAITTTVLVEAKYAEAAQTTQYEAAATTKVVIDKATVTNVSGAPAALSVNLVEDGGVAAADNLIVDAQNVDVNQCYILAELIGHVLAPGDSISTLADTATALVLRISGREIA